MGSEIVASKIPVVELSCEKLKADSNLWNSACQEVREALEKYGCFELIYDKYSIENQNAIREAIEQLFNVAVEMKTEDKHLSLDQGYHGKSSLLPLVETLTIMNPMDKQECQNFTNLMWPHGNQHVCETLHSEAMLLVEMQELVVKMLLESYGLNKENIESHLKSTHFPMLLHKYERSNQADTNVGMKHHTDKTFLSILHQNVKGLAVRLNNGDDWTLYEPSSQPSVIVLAGDVCMGWSNDRIKSCYHRVVIEGKEVRYSTGSFGYMKGLIEAPKELVDEKHPLKYKPFDNQEFLASCNFGIDPDKFEINCLKAFCGI